MSTHPISTHTEHIHDRGATIPTFAKVWVTLLALTGVEVFLAYEQVPTLIMLTVLVGLSVIKAALIYVDVQALRLTLGPAKRTAVDISAIFWHFLDGLWLYLMLLFYVWG